MMTPIKRIPQMDSDRTLGQIVSDESRREVDPGDILTVLIDHTGNQDAISDTLDWAMQLRDTLGIDWGTAIDVAMTMYFG